MQRVKLAFVALVAFTGVFAVSGCQANPDQAASVGPVSIDHGDVDAAVDIIEADLRDSPRPLAREDIGTVRQIVVQFTLFNELARRYTQEKGLTVPPRDYAAAAQQTGLPENDPYVRLSADAEAYRTALLASAKPVTPTEADLREIYNRYAAAAGAEAVSYEEVKPQLLGVADLPAGLAVRNELAAAALRYGVSVNPRYAPLEVPIVSVSGGLALVALPLGEQGTGAVRDI